MLRHWGTTSLPGDHIHLIVPMVGGIFAEAYAYANLRLIPHTFQLRLSRFSQTYDEVPCVLYLDDRGVLTLDRDDGSISFRRRSNASVPLFIDENNIITLYKAAIKAHDNLPRSLSELARATMDDSNPNMLIRWWCHFLVPRITIFWEGTPEYVA